MFNFKFLFNLKVLLISFVIISCGKHKEEVDNSYQKSIYISNLTTGYWMLTNGNYDTCLTDNKYYFKDDYTLEVDYGDIDCKYDNGGFPLEFEPGYWYVDNRTFDLVLFTKDTIYRTSYFELIGIQDETGLRMRILRDNKPHWNTPFVYFSRFE